VYTSARYLLAIKKRFRCFGAALGGIKGDVWKCKKTKYFVMRSRSFRNNCTSIQAAQHFILGHCPHVCKTRRTSRLRFCLWSVDHASLWGLVNETHLVHDLFLVHVYFVNFIYNPYMFRPSPGPSSGGTTVFMRHFVLVILYSCLVCRMECIPSCIPDRQLYRITSIKCRINTVVPSDDGPGDGRNM